MHCSPNKPLITLLLLTLSTTNTLAHSQANGHDLDLDHDLDDASCTPADVDPSPIQHLYAEDGMEVNLILISPELSFTNPRCQI